MTILNPILSREEIHHIVERVAHEVEMDYQGKNPVLLGVLKGSFVFMADLVRLLNMPLEIEFISLSSYGKGRKESSGEVEVVQGLKGSLEGRDVLVVEDIVDAGTTMAFLLDYLKRGNPASLKLCALFDKPSRRKTPVTIDYLGTTVSDVFLVGYGLDYDEKYRNLPGLCELVD